MSRADCLGSMYRNGGAIQSGRGLLKRPVAGLLLFAAGMSTITVPPVRAEDWMPTWSTATLSSSRSYLAAASAGNKVLFAGGFDNSYSSSNVVDIYDATAGTWSTATLSQASMGLTAASVGNEVLFGGGFTTGATGGSLSNVVDIYDATAGTWSTAALSQARMDLTAASVGNKVLFGGGDTDSGYGNVDIYDATAGTWSTAALSQPCADLAAASVGNKVLFGGGTGYNYSNAVDIYDATAGTWSTAALSQARAYLAAASVGNEVLFGRGITGSGYSSNVVDIFKVSQDYDTITSSKAFTLVDQTTVGGLMQLSTPGSLAMGKYFLAVGSMSGNAPIDLGSATLTAGSDNTPSTTYSGALSGAGGFVKTGTGALVLVAANTYIGDTTISGGTLQIGNGGSGEALASRAIFNSASLVFNHGDALTYAGVISGSGSLAKIGTGMLTLTSALNASGAIAVSQGTLAVLNGIPLAGPAITLPAAATLQAGGQIKRAVSGPGAITATNDLIIGSSTQTGQFNQGGAPGSGGTLNVGGNAVVILSADAAILGTQTNLGNGGSLTTLHGAQLGNSSSSDATKVLTATGNATINGNFVNNGVVNGPTGSGKLLTFTQAVKGAGSTTGNIEYQGSYSPGNSPAAVSVQNVQFDSTSALIMELGGLLPGTGYDQLDVSGQATLNGRLDVDLLNGFTPSAGQSFDLFSGSTTGGFSQINLPALRSGLSWDTSKFYTTGVLSVSPSRSPTAVWTDAVSGNWGDPNKWVGGVPNSAGAGAAFQRLNHGGRDGYGGWSQDGRLAATGQLG